MSKARFEAGLKVRREVLGDERVDKALAGVTALTAPFQEYVTKDAWGDVWGRPQLDRRSRSIVTLSILTALRIDEELAGHVKGAIRNGLTPTEIAEIILQSAVYAGVPSAYAAIRVAQRTLAEMGFREAMPLSAAKPAANAVALARARARTKRAPKTAARSAAVKKGSK